MNQCSLLRDDGDGCDDDYDTAGSLSHRCGDDGDDGPRSSDHRRHRRDRRGPGKTGSFSFSKQGELLSFLQNQLAHLTAVQIGQAGQMGPHSPQTDRFRKNGSGQFCLLGQHPQTPLIADFKILRLHDFEEIANHKRQKKIGYKILSLCQNDKKHD